MTTELATIQKAIVMKTGLVLWVAEERANYLEDILASQDGHKFVKIDDETINTAQIEGIYKREKYEELVKIKRGMWQCSYLQWHNRTADCECRIDVNRKREMVVRGMRRMATEGEITDPMQRESVQRYIDEDTVWLKQRGIMV